MRILHVLLTRDSYFVHQVSVVKYCSWVSHLKVKASDCIVVSQGRNLVCYEQETKQISWRGSFQCIRSNSKDGIEKVRQSTTKKLTKSEIVRPAFLFQNNSNHCRTGGLSSASSISLCACMFGSHYRKDPTKSFSGGRKTIIILIKIDFHQHSPFSRGGSEGLPPPAGSSAEMRGTALLAPTLVLEQLGPE